MILTVFNKSGGNLSTPLGVVSNGASLSQEMDQNKYIKILPELSALQSKNYITYLVGAQSGSEGARTTTSDVDVYVDANLGKDSNPGTQTQPFLTIQAALNSLPKLLMHQATVHVAVGTYAGFVISGFSADNSVQQVTGGLLIDGVLVNSTLATGSATGAATSGTTGGGITYGTLTDTGATWTVNDLTGRLLVTANPINTNVISSNTATTITVVGPLALPTGATTYKIRDPGTIINTAVKIANEDTFGEAGIAGIIVAGNRLDFTNRALTIRSLRIAPASALMGVNLSDSSYTFLTQVQIRPGGSFPAGVYSAYTGAGAPFVEITASDISINSVANGINALAGGLGLQGNLIRNAQGSATAIVVGQGQSKSSTTLQTCLYNATTGFLNGLAIPFGTFSDDFSGIKGMRVIGGATGVGFSVGTLTGAGTSVSGSGRAGHISIASANVSGCTTAVQVIGPATADVVALSGSAVTTGFDVRLGGVVTYTKATTTLTAGVNEVNIESGEVVGTFAAGTAGQARVSSVSGNYSRVRAR